MCQVFWLCSWKEGKWIWRVSLMEPLWWKKLSKYMVNSCWQENEWSGIDMCTLLLGKKNCGSTTGNPAHCILWVSFKISYRYNTFCMASKVNWDIAALYMVHILAQGGCSNKVKINFRCEKNSYWSSCELINGKFWELDWKEVQHNMSNVTFI